MLANTQQLHDRIENLCSRIRELESALQTIQARVSQEPHPLLRNDLLQLKAPQNDLTTPQAGTLQPQSDGKTVASSSSVQISGQPPAENGRSDLPDEHFIDAFGTFSA